MLEIKDHSKSKVNITCDLYQKGKNVKDHTLTLQMPFQSPRPFVFSEQHNRKLEPDTEYVAVFSGVRKEDATRCFAIFKTKPDFTHLVAPCSRFLILQPKLTYMAPVEFGL